MLLTDYQSTAILNRQEHSIGELIPFISQQILIGNYTNYSLLISLFELRQVKQFHGLDMDLQERITAIKHHCEQEVRQPSEHALVLLGTLYLYGITIHMKIRQCSCFEQAMIFNNSYALNNRGYMYQLGLGSKKNNDEAIKLFRQATDLNNSLAMTNLAGLYQQGFTEKAVRLYEQAIALGNTYAMTNLACLYIQQGNTNKAILLYKSHCIR